MIETSELFGEKDKTHETLSPTDPKIRIIIGIIRAYDRLFLFFLGSRFSRLSHCRLVDMEI